MRICGVWTFFFKCLSFLTIANCKSGFLLTSPKVIDSGSTANFVLTLLDVPEDGTVVLTLRSKKNDSIIAQSSIPASNETNRRVEMEVPSISDSEAWLEIRGNFSGEYQISKRKTVGIRHKSVIIFVQTDKPIYKPGQTVRFRVLPLDSQLKALVGNRSGDVWIEDPGSVRIAQWTKLNFSLGIIQLELPLSEEPVLGVWFIKISINGFSHYQRFTVAEYVLPKFEVTIKAPKYVLRDLEASDFSVEICAHYTYGKEVNGLLRANLTARPYRYFLPEVSFPRVDLNETISGCYKFLAKPRNFFKVREIFWWNDILLVAEVTENTTGVAANGSVVIGIKDVPAKLKFLNYEKGYGYFKPGLALYETLQASKPDNTPFALETVEICSELQGGDDQKTLCKNFTTNERGIIAFSALVSSSMYDRLNLRAKARTYVVVPRRYHKQPLKNISLKSWYSPTKKFLQIGPVDYVLRCGETQRVKIRYTADNESTINFHHQVISRGRIVQQGSSFHTFNPTEDSGLSQPAQEVPDFSFEINDPTLHPYIGEFTLDLRATASMSPTARLLVFYIRSDGEVVADSKEFDVPNCLLSQTSLSFRNQQQYPSTEAEVVLSANPFSLCAVGLVDKSVQLMAPDGQIQKEKVSEVMKGYDLGQNTAPKQISTDHCHRRESLDLHLDEHRRRRSLMSRSLPRRSYSYFYTAKNVDSITAFENAGMVVISDYAIETRTCHRTSYPHRSRGMPGSLLPMRRRFKAKTLFRSGTVHFLNASVDEEREIPSSLQEDETALTVVSEEKAENTTRSVAEIRSYFPETWLWELHTVRENGETSFNRTLPDTVTEWVGKAVCIHPESGLGISNTAKITAFQPFFLSFTLPYSAVREEVIPVGIAVFNYLTECIPIKLSLEENEEYEIVHEPRTHRLCVCGSESKAHKFYIRPVTLGRVNITVHGHSQEDAAICGNKTAVNLVARDAVTRQLLVEAEGFPKEEIHNSYFCPHESNGTFSTKIQLQLPTNVVEGSARAYATVIGDIMGPALNNLQDLVQLPTGCGEQNMIRFVPNIFVLDYLTETGRITQDIKTKTMHHMETGYQRELRYRHSDGSYSAFGESDKEGSLWLTAFVVRSFAQAKRFIPIDEKDLSRSINWIVQNQMDNGCFRRIGTVVHGELKGGLVDNAKSLAPLTAYVLISLLEAGVVEEDVVRNATDCLRSDANPGTYSLALFSYATALAKDPEADNYLKMLESRAVRSESLMYWNSSSLSVDIETAGYAVLAMLEAEGRSSVPKVLQIVRWITQQRNSKGGFKSTQDTVVALQALTKYSSLLSRAQVDIDTVIKCTELTRRFAIDESNKLVLQSAKLPVVPTAVELKATGEGCALAQFTLKYNVKFSTASEAFSLDVHPSRNQSKNCKKASIGICMRYKILTQTTNMIVLTVKMISGYVPDKTSIEKLYENQDLPLKRHDISGSDVHFYFSELTNEQKCFQFVVKDALHVENTKPAIVKLYDYYQTEWEVSKSYEIPSCTVSTQSSGSPNLL